MIRNVSFWLAGICLLGVSCLATAAPEMGAEAGKVLMLVGQATALGNDGTVRRLAKNDPVYSGDLINSNVGSYVNIKFADGAFFLLRPKTRFQIEQYQYSPATPKAAATAAAPTPAPTAPIASTAAPLVTAQQQQSSATSRAFFRLLKGGFRSVSGLIGKIDREDYRVNTPVATIGIRGTVYSARLCQGPREDRDCEDRDQISALLREAGKSADTDETVLITTVDEGEIAVTSPKTTSNQPAGTVAFTTDDGSVTPVKEAPKTEQQEKSLDPKTCGG